VKVGLDIDGVVADFLPAFLRCLEKKVGNGPISLDSIVDMSFKRHPHLTLEMVEECMVTVSYDPDFWLKLPPLISSEEWRALDRLSREERLVFVTHRYERDTYDINGITCEWLKRHGVSKPVVYFTQSVKSKLVEDRDIRLFVDDRHENCQDVAENTRAKVLMPDRLYNRSFSHPKVTRIRNLKEIFDLLP
jgi:uncharacterized HAD superfamily protein